VEIEWSLIVSGVRRVASAGFIHLATHYPGAIAAVAPAYRGRGYTIP